jgi:outer membrane protein assembly factor BamB
VARDDKFTDIVFDRAVFGTEYAVANLEPGRYYWRVAPAVKETGVFSAAKLIEITGQGETRTGVGPETQTPVAADTTRGWRTITGAINQPLRARLRANASSDLVGVNTDGRVYALDGVNGLPLWVRRFREGSQAGGAASSAPSTFTPIIISGRDGMDDLVVAFDGGVRALDGATGGELWKAALANRAVTGSLSAPSADGTRVLMVFTDSAPSLTLLNPSDGKIISEMKLDRPITGSPIPFPNGGVIIAFADGGLEVRDGKGEKTRAVKMDTKITTPPLVVTGPRGSLVLVGTESGLISLNAEDLKPIGRIATGDEVPRGMLAAADLDNDNAPEVLMITNRGRIAAINTTDGKIRWHKAGATDAASATFADLDDDGVLDVLIAASPSFARGFSGRDGALIWRAEEEAKGGTAGTQSAELRSLVIIGSGPDSFIVGTDVGRKSLRAIGLPKSSAKANRE